LTRAFLVVLRLVPPVQAAFIDAIREKHLSGEPAPWSLLARRPIEV
jgi:hypothetical protein